MTQFLLFFYYFDCFAWLHYCEIKFHICLGTQAHLRWTWVHHHRGHGSNGRILPPMASQAEHHQNSFKCLPSSQRQRWSWSWTHCDVKWCTPETWPEACLLWCDTRPHTELQRAPYQDGGQAEEAELMKLVGTSWGCKMPTLCEPQPWHCATQLENTVPRSGLDLHTQTSLMSSLILQCAWSLEKWNPLHYHGYLSLQTLNRTSAAAQSRNW